MKRCACNNCKRRNFHKVQIIWRIQEQNWHKNKEQKYHFGTKAVLTCMLKTCKQLKEKVVLHFATTWENGHR